MSDGGGPETWKVFGILTSLWVFIAGMLHLRTNKANDTATSVKIALGEFYMKREEVKDDIREAEDRFNTSLQNVVKPIHGRLSRIENGLDELNNWLRDHQDK